MGRNERRRDHTGRRTSRAARRVLGAATGLLLASGWTGSHVRAQEAPPPPDATRSARQEVPPAPSLLRALDLTSEQESAVREVLDEHRTRAREAGALWEAAAEIRDILEPEQIAVLADLLAERPMRAAARRGGPGEPAAGSRGQRTRRPDRGSRRGPGAGPGPRIEGLEQLDLSDPQRAELKSIREIYAPRMREIWTGLREGTVSEDEAEEQLRVVRDSIHQAVQEVLTPEQRTRLEEHEAAAAARRQQADELREARRDSARARMEARMSAEREAMAEILDLSAEQVSALDALRDEATEAYEGLRPGVDRPSAEELTALREARHEAVMEILDEAQAEVWVVHAALVGMEWRRRAAGLRLREPARRRTSRSGR